MLSTYTLNDVWEEWVHWEKQRLDRLDGSIGFVSRRPLPGNILPTKIWGLLRGGVFLSLLGDEIAKAGGTFEFPYSENLGWWIGFFKLS